MLFRAELKPLYKMLKCVIWGYARGMWARDCHFVLTCCVFLLVSCTCKKPIDWNLPECGSLTVGEEAFGIKGSSVDSINSDNAVVIVPVDSAEGEIDLTFVCR